MSKKAMKRAQKRARVEDAAATPAVPVTEEEAQPTTSNGARTENVAPKEETMMGDIEIKRDYAGPKCTNKQKCLTFGTRNMSYKERHILQDLRDMLPHTRDHAKVALAGGADHRESRSSSASGHAASTTGELVKELCNLNHCNSTMFLESHKHDIAYMWLAQAPNGPSIKLKIDNIHTADQLRMVGNCLKFSRPLLHFDKEFDQLPHLRVARSLLQTIFNVPRFHPKSKPFVDHIVCFFFLDDHIWLRHYQIVPPAAKKLVADGEYLTVGKHKPDAVEEDLSSAKKTPTLMEIGPRFTMHPQVILNGCCGGSALWKNPLAVPPSEARRSRKERQLAKLKENEHVQKVATKHRRVIGDAPSSGLEDIFK